jgi:hypothetical protein
MYLVLVCLLLVVGASANPNVIFGKALGRIGAGIFTGRVERWLNKAVGGGDEFLRDVIRGRPVQQHNFKGFKKHHVVLHDFWSHREWEGKGHSGSAAWVWANDRLIEDLTRDGLMADGVMVIHTATRHVNGFCCCRGLAKSLYSILWYEVGDTIYVVDDQLASKADLGFQDQMRAQCDSDVNRQFSFTEVPPDVPMDKLVVTCVGSKDDPTTTTWLHGSKRQFAHD